MSILKAMYTAASGMNAHAGAISVVSDNIANVNTIGYKSARASFESVLGSTVAGAVENKAAGLGVRLGGVHAIWSQGSMLGSRSRTDMAIQGDGFFVLRGAFDGLQDGKFFSRDGQLNIANEGALGNPKGLVVQGYLADENEILSSTLSPLTIPLTSIVAPKKSGTVEIGTNLSPQTSFISAWTAAANEVADPEANSLFSTAVTVYDTLGVDHNINTFFNQTATGTWEWHAIANGEEMAELTDTNSDGTPDVPLNPTGNKRTGNVRVAHGTQTFDTSGKLTAQTTVIADNDMSFFNADPDQVIAFSFGDDTASGGTGLKGATQFDAPSSVSKIAQDGYASGALAGVNIELDGKIIGTFTNGERRTLAAVALARFVNNDGLIRRDAGMYAESPDSGQALIGQAGNGGRGSLMGLTLEQSTVELANEFVNVIAFQRGFQANSRAISTADDLLMEAVNLKR